MLIQKLLKKHYTVDYCFIKYNTFHGNEVITIALNMTRGFYDLLNERYINDSQVVFKKPITDYVDTKEDLIREKRAKEMAEKHLREFRQDYKREYCSENKTDGVYKIL